MKQRYLQHFFLNQYICVFFFLPDYAVYENTDTEDNPPLVDIKVEPEDVTQNIAEDTGDDTGIVLAILFPSCNIYAHSTAFSIVTYPL